MPQVGFEPTISTGERPQTYALDRAATGTGITYHYFIFFEKQTIKSLQTQKIVTHVKVTTRNSKCYYVYIYIHTHTI